MTEIIATITNVSLDTNRRTLITYDALMVDDGGNQSNVAGQVVEMHALSLGDPDAINAEIVVDVETQLNVSGDHRVTVWGGASYQAA